MKYIDLSHKITDNFRVFPDDPNFSLKNISNEKEDYSLFKMKGGLHVGTHIDSPFHFFKNSQKVSDLSLNNLIGKINVLNTNNLTTNTEINVENLNSFNIIENDLEKIIILNTGWGKNFKNLNYFTKNPYLSKELAKIFIEKNISGIAIDTPNVDNFGKSNIHKMLLKNNIWIVENLTNLEKLGKKRYFGYFIPMNIEAEASYIRAFVER